MDVCRPSPETSSLPDPQGPVRSDPARAETRQAPGTSFAPYPIPVLAAPKRVLAAFQRLRSIRTYPDAQRDREFDKKEAVRLMEEFQARHPSVKVWRSHPSWLFFRFDLTDAYSAALAYRLSADWNSRELRELRGKDLVCWCPLDQPCNADVLLEYANS